MKKEIVRHLTSFGITFGASFLILLYPAISQGTWDGAVIVAAVFAAGRSALKIAYELAILPLANLLLAYAKKLRSKSSN